MRRHWFVALAGPRLAYSQQSTSATFGNVIQLSGGTPSDVVLDEPRHRLYLVYNNTSRVNIFDYTTNVVTGSISVGKSPMAAALSMDGGWLYVTSGATPTQTASGTPLLNVIDLSQDRVVQSVVLPSIPQGVETGNDGRALVSMLGSGVVSGVPQNTLAVFDRTPHRRPATAPGQRPGPPHHSRAAAGHHPDPADQDLYRLAAAHAGRAVHCRGHHPDQRQHVHLRL